MSHFRVMAQIVLDSSLLLVWKWAVYLIQLWSPASHDDALSDTLIDVADGTFTVGAFIAAVWPLTRTGIIMSIRGWRWVSSVTDTGRPRRRRLMSRDPTHKSDDRLVLPAERSLWDAYKRWLQSAAIIALIGVLGLMFNTVGEPIAGEVLPPLLGIEVPSWLKPLEPLTQLPLRRQALVLSAAVVGIHLVLPSAFRWVWKRGSDDEGSLIDGTIADGYASPLKSAPLWPLPHAIPLPAPMLQGLGPGLVHRLGYSGCSP